ncbi:NAD(P)-dependent alcohol dehydrogenase [Leucobacter rhizosphaerae]|uniref:NAD(P)-dependent alcohol dehydrogenase n=1 Tax=Leucobacter rhizosphaerae TaxID=2932245 RepID=A0ABY4FS72_9MICO|nr:NAD(P)-dependent alcohol dehydrogenase [Leucobacter rhizosphaerae]UOQ59125.1 NAD(P)-dependent alcohol dehydrogenase [Leucobacter rhizosphaerae]
MQAAVVHRYGPPEAVRIATRDDPAPRRGEVLVRVESAAVTSGDARIRAGRFPAGFGALARLAIGMRGPRRPILGGTFSGVVAGLGPDTDGFTIGDAVSGMTGARFGAHAELLVAPTRSTTPKPEALSHDAAAAVLFGGSTAWHFLHDRAKMRAGDRVLVNGGSGSVGVSAIQLARRAGAHVTAVVSPRNRDLMLALGADEVIDYTATPVSELRGDTDIVLDTVGNITRADGPRLLAPNGSLLLAVASLRDTVLARGRVHAGPAPERADRFATLLDLAAAGSLAPVAETLGGLAALPDAYRIIDSGRKIGNLVIRPGL